MKKIFRQISHFFARKTLKRNLLNRRIHRETMMFQDTKEIGLLFVAHSDEDIETANKYIDKLKSEGKKVEFIGYIAIKDYQKKHKGEEKNPNYIFDNDFDFFHRPRFGSIEKFYKKEFDLLISLNYSNQFSLNYISSLSRAKLRVGKFNQSSVAAYDFMIDDKANSMESLIEQLTHYLQKIKK